MTVYISALLVSALIITWIIGQPLLRHYRHQHLSTQAFPEHWRQYLGKNWPVYGYLHETVRSLLHGHIRIFLHEVRFIGCRGFKITEPIRLLIAAQACLLIVHKGFAHYGNLRSILVYPSAYVREVLHIDAGGVVNAQQNVLAGESWHQGRVVLAWEEIQHSNFNREDGYHVVYHEFAHQLDQHDGVANGAPLLDDPQRYRRWSEVFQRAYDQLRSDCGYGRQTLYSCYGCESPAEFFAVATEVFFEKPASMKHQDPDLYGELNHYFRLDPASWFRE